MRKAGCQNSQWLGETKIRNPADQRCVEGRRCGCRTEWQRRHHGRRRVGAIDERALLWEHQRHRHQGGVFFFVRNNHGVLANENLGAAGDGRRLIRPTIRGPKEWPSTTCMRHAFLELGYNIGSSSAMGLISFAHIYMFENRWTSANF